MRIWPVKPRPPASVICRSCSGDGICRIDAAGRLELEAPWREVILHWPGASSRVFACGDLCEARLRRGAAIVAPPPTGPAAA